jgi:hypothetical protein
MDKELIIIILSALIVFLYLWDKQKEKKDVKYFEFFKKTPVSQHDVLADNVKKFLTEKKDSENKKNDKRNQN